MSTSAEKEFHEWQRQLALRAAAAELKELNNIRPPTTETVGPGSKKEERVYPYMACPNERQLLDPLQGCSDCAGVGYHHSIPNPRWNDPDAVRWNAFEVNY